MTLETIRRFVAQHSPGEDARIDMGRGVVAWTGHCTVLAEDRATVLRHESYEVTARTMQEALDELGY